MVKKKVIKEAAVEEIEVKEVKPKDIGILPDKQPDPSFDVDYSEPKPNMVKILIGDKKIEVDESLAKHLLKILLAKGY